MSELINNRQRGVNERAHHGTAPGKSVDEVKERFASLTSISGEISAMERAIAQGLPVEEVQRLCDVHAAVFKGSLEKYHRAAAPGMLPATGGHF